MNQKIWTKLLASLLVVTLTFANFIMLGVYASNTYATEDNLEKQETITNNENVVFDAYFKDEEGNITHTTREDIESQDLKLYVSLEVKRGYLKNATIQVLGENGTNSNLKIKNSSDTSENIEAIDNNTNTISLKQINAGTQIVLEIPVVACKEDIYDLSNFSKLDDIIIKGNYIGDNGKETNIEKAIKTRVEWKAEVTPVLEQQLTRFIPYAVGEKSGTILQTIIKSGISENVLPVEETRIEITVPQIDGNNPESVNVIPNGVLATNGMTQEEFSKYNWSYDSKTGIVIILVRNEANENKVSWLKNTLDEFVVTYNFSEKIDIIQSTQKVISEIKAYNSVETKVSKEDELAITQNGVLGQIVTANVTATEALSKGYLYTKANRETLYEENVTIDVAYPELVDALNIEQNMDYFVNNKGQISPTTVGNTNYAYYKSSKISKVNFEKILGQDGSLKILTLDGKELVTINKDTVADENGNYVYNYEEEVNGIRIQTSTPIETGKLEIVHEKALKGNTDYSKSQVESFKTLELKALVQAYIENNVISENESAKEITLIAPTTKVETESSNQNLSTVVTNENVELRVILKTNDITCDLYKNPTIELVLPNYIKQINIKDINLLFDNELSIKEYNTYVNETGNVVIYVTLQGEQTKYSGDEISKGANLIINADITLKELTPTRNDVVKVYVTNELATSYENVQQTISRTRTVQKGYSETSLNAVAPVGIVTTSEISGYNEKNETITAISGNEQIGKLDVKKDTRTANVNMNVINNYQNKVNNMVILGRVLAESSKNADTLEDFGSNLKSSMASTLNVTGVDAKNVEVYYSTNESATNDLSVSTNVWTKSPENIANVKSYLIVVSGDIETGTTLGISYNLNIPENLSYDTKGYSNYVVYFDNVKETETIKEKAVSAKIGLETGEGPELEVSISSDIEGSDVQEGQIITYTIAVKNIGKSEAKNVTVSGNIPEKAVYTWFEGNEEGQNEIVQNYDAILQEYSEVIESILIGETKKVTYKVQTKDLVISYDKDNNPIVEQANITAQANVKIEGFDNVFTSSTITNKLIQGYLNVTIETAPIKESVVRRENEEVQYVIEIDNINSEEKQNVVVTSKLPNGLEFLKVDELGKYDETTNTVIWDLGTLKAYANKILLLNVKTEYIEGQETQKEITNTVEVKTKDMTIEKQITINVAKPKLSIIQTSENASKEVQVGDTIMYHITVKNEGRGEARTVRITDIIPDGVTYKSTQYSVGGNVYKSSTGEKESFITIPSIPAGDTVELTITVEANKLENGVSRKDITNVVKVKATDIDEVIANEITHTIVEKQISSDDPSIDELIEGTHTISGIAWLDENGDGKRDDNEKRMNGISVILINAENGQIVKDIKTGKEKKQETNSNGGYVFANLSDGNYMVVFLYNSADYRTTFYKKEGVNEDKNSDAVQVNIVYEGVSKVAGASDKLNLNGENILNIDIGLTNVPKFDLSLDKVISNIVVSDVDGTDVYDYKDTKLAKVDLNSKRAIGSTIIIEYKIRVTNEGGVAGYAKKIVDYMPNDMKFNSELNKDWYASGNGTNLYNASLANELIEPGETKEITLLLSKTITESNMGIINNTAEIAESYNDLGLIDIDSTPANRVQNEDDLSNADAIIGTKTGEIYLYITLTLVIISMLGVGIYLINKKILKRG